MPQSLVFTKRTCQAFACLEISKQTVDMEISDVRRDRLRAWYSSRSIPEREKSYISQLLSGKSSFGEKAARRLEKQYGMPHLYLDENNVVAAEQKRKSYTSSGSLDATPEEVEVLAAYRMLNRNEQLMVLKMLGIKAQDFAKSA